MDKNQKEKIPWLKSKKKPVLRNREGYAHDTIKDGEKLLAKPIKATWFNKSSLDKLGIRRC